MDLATAEGLYLRALHILSGRAVAVPRGQIVLWHLGIALWVVGFFSPIHTLGDDLLTAHMAQHLLIADLAAPLLLAGARNPVLAFLLPRPALVTLARSGAPRRAFPAAAGAAGGDPGLRAGPVGVALLDLLRCRRAPPVRARAPAHELHRVRDIVWWAALDPKRRRVHGDLWKIPYLLGARMVGMFLGMSFALCFFFFKASQEADRDEQREREALLTSP